MRRRRIGDWLKYIQGSFSAERGAETKLKLEGFGKTAYLPK